MYHRIGVAPAGCRRFLCLNRLLPAVREELSMSFATRSLSYIGLNLHGPESASLFEKIIYGLLIFIPIAFLVEVLGLGAGVLFVTSALAIIPLAKILGTATEELASRVGAGLGGLLNATFGNATELIIAVVALNAGLAEVVKASLVGSI